MPDLPLDGVRVVDLTTVVSGPYGTLLLSDFGADVVKVESPGGDVARDLGPRAHDGMAAVFLACNRGKRSVVLDLQTEDGRARLAELVAGSDVLVHNMRRDAAVRCGADPDTLLAVNPALVHCAIVGFGADGPYADLPAYDDTVQAVSRHRRRAVVDARRAGVRSPGTGRQGGRDGGCTRDRRGAAQARARR